MSMNTKTTEYLELASQAAHLHNLLNPNERAAFDLATRENHEDAASWAQLVVFDLSSRCRSFTPPILTRLVALGRECGMLEAP